MLQSLQACRAIAALLVVFFHASCGIFALEKYFGHKPFGPVFDFGYAGVDFFFVLSGFIMMHIHARDFGKPVALGPYAWKRFSRIYPPYWAVLVVILPVFFLVPHFGLGFERNPDVIATSVALFPHPQVHLVLGVAWTLVYEVFFYLLFGLLILNKRLGLAAFGAWAACVFAYPWFESYPWNFLFSFLNLRFLAGMAVAVIVQRWKMPAPRLLAFAGAALFLATGMFNGYGRELSALEQTIGYTLGGALAITGLVEAERSGLLKAPRLLVYLGDASYAIYLVHFLALSLLAKIAKAAHLDAFIPSHALFMMHVLGAVAIGCAFHHVIERPLHRWTKHLLQPRQQRPDAKEPPSEPIRKAA